MAMSSATAVLRGADGTGRVRIARASRGWLQSPATEVVTHTAVGLSDPGLQAKVFDLERRVEVLTAAMRLLLALVRVMDSRLERRRLPRGEDKAAILRAVERTSKTISLRSSLRIVGLSSSRYYAWKRAELRCLLDDVPTCPRSRPTRLTAVEMATMKEMATSPDFRHVPTTTLARLAQRMGRVFVSATTWSRLIRERRWRRPRARVHPARPKEGLRTTKPDEAWHVDTTVFRLLDGTKAYVQAIIDNYSRRILSWRISARLEPAATASLLVKAGEASRQKETDLTRATTLMVDGGVENFNEAVDQLVDGGALKRIVAQTDIRFSNSMIESFWRALKHNWCYQHQLDSLATLERLAAFYIDQHNRVLPHAAFDGQTPDEMYFATGEAIPGQLKEARARARAVRLEANRAARCSQCASVV